MFLIRCWDWVEQYFLIEKKKIKNYGLFSIGQDQITVLIRCLSDDISIGHIQSHIIFIQISKHFQLWPSDCIRCYPILVMFIIIFHQLPILINVHTSTLVCMLVCGYVSCLCIPCDSVTHVVVYYDWQIMLIAKMLHCIPSSQPIPSINQAIRNVCWAKT